MREPEVRHTVLLVDDDRRLLDALRRKLRREPYRLLLAESADEGLRAMVAHDVDVVVSDEKMPGLPGSDFLERVRAHRPDTVRILLTGCRDFELAMRAINRGEVHRFFLKPCDSDELASTLRAALEQRELLRLSRRLLATVKQQAAALDELEAGAPGLTLVRRDADGCILVDEGGASELETLLADMEAELERAERRPHSASADGRDVPRPERQGDTP